MRSPSAGRGVSVGFAISPEPSTAAGLVFVGRVEVEKDSRGDDKNVIKAAIQPDHKEYAALMGQPVRMSSPASAAPQSATPSAPAVPTRPAWAQ